MKTFSKKKLAIAIALGLGLAVSSTAGAGVLATSTVDIFNLKFTNDSGTAFSSGTDLNIATATNTASASVVLNGSGEAILNAQVAAPGGIDFPINNPGALVLPAGNDLCLGACAPIGGNNDFTTNLYSSALGDPTTTISFADELLTGAAIDFPGLAAGAREAVEATIQATGNANGNSTSQNGLSSTFSFVFTGTSTFFNISFDAKAYLETFVDPSSFYADALALAQYSVSFNLKDITAGTTILDWAPGTAATVGSSTDSFLLNSTISNDEVNTGSRTITGGTVGKAASGSFTAKSNTALVAGHQYSITAATTTTATINAIPEPATLALLGVGLIGMGLSSRKGKRANLVTAS